MAPVAGRASGGRSVVDVPCPCVACVACVIECGLEAAAEAVAEFVAPFAVVV